MVFGRGYTATVQHASSSRCSGDLSHLTSMGNHDHLCVILRAHYLDLLKALRFLSSASPNRGKKSSHCTNILLSLAGTDALYCRSTMKRTIDDRIEGQAKPRECILFVGQTGIGKIMAIMLENKTMVRSG